jgi:cysteine desulfuration protein SufE
MHNNHHRQCRRLLGQRPLILDRRIGRVYLIGMSDASTSSSSPPLPPSIARVLRYFQSLGREEKMQALVAYSKRLEPVPERFRELDANAFAVPECQTKVDLFPEFRDGKMHYYADLNARQSPTIAAFLAILFSTINEQPPSTALAIPDDFVRQVMEGIGLAGREVGLTAMLLRIKRYAQQAAVAAA